MFKNLAMALCMALRSCCMAALLSLIHISPSFVTSIVVRMLMSICSPMQIVTVPQFCMPVSFKERCV